MPGEGGKMLDRERYEARYLLSVVASIINQTDIPRSVRTLNWEMCIRVRIIVANELEEEEFLSLKMLMPGVKEKEIRKFQLLRVSWRNSI